MWVGGCGRGCLCVFVGGCVNVTEVIWVGVLVCGSGCGCVYGFG